jgi:hypothetical protein
VTAAVKDIEYYARALRARRIADGYRSLGDRAREAGWSHEEYLAAVLSREAAEREASGAALRIRANNGSARSLACLYPVPPFSALIQHKAPSSSRELQDY